jgi:zinc protease
MVKLCFSQPLCSSQPSHTLPGPENITRRRLENGMIVLGRPNFNNPSVVINGYLPAGSLFDPDPQLGLADFTASCLMHGTTHQNHQQIYDALESVGASLGFSSGVHTVGFHGRALIEDLELLLALLAECLRDPIFPLAEVERLRAQMLTSLAMRAQDTGDMASLAFDQLVYANHPYSRPEDGYPETVQRIFQSDLSTFHQKHYGPGGLVMAVVGAIDPQAAIEKVNRVLGDWKNPNQSSDSILPALTPLEQTTRRTVTIPGKSQTDLSMGIAGPPRRSTDFLPAALGNDIFGQFGMMGRIGEAVREQAGLAYYAQSSLGSGLGPGPWAVSAGVDPANLEQVIQLILREIQRFTNEPVNPAELADSQACFIGRLPISLESNQGVAAALLHLERYGLDQDYYYRYPDLVRSVTVQDVLETARRFWNPDHLAIAAAGP